MFTYRKKNTDHFGVSADSEEDAIREASRLVAAGVKRVDPGLDSDFDEDSGWYVIDYSPETVLS